MFCRCYIAPIKDQRVIVFYRKFTYCFIPSSFDNTHRVFTGIWYLDPVCVHWCVVSCKHYRSVTCCSLSGLLVEVKRLLRIKLVVSCVRCLKLDDGWPADDPGSRLQHNQFILSSNR